MTSTAFILASIGFGGLILGVFISIAQFALWLSASRDREHAFYAVVVGAALAGCAQTSTPSDRFSNTFFDKDSDSSHSEWLARVKAQKL